MESKTYTIDASGKVLGRLAVEIADLLRGKNRSDFLPYLDQYNCVTVFNTNKVKITGKKLKQKLYYRHTGYTGHLKVKKMDDLFEKDSAELLKKTVYGMLPKNKLRDRFIKRLKCYAKDNKNNN